MTEPKLLTEAEARELYSRSENGLVDALRKRGLIAPEPVDPLLIEAREIVASWFEERGKYQSALGYRSGEWDNSLDVEIALAALRRGMELAQPKLTREMVQEAAKTALRSCTRMLAASDFESTALDDDKRNIAAFVTRLHAALTTARQARGEG